MNRLIRPSLKWPGKGESLNALAWPSYSILEYQSELSYGDQNTGNLLIQADNLYAMQTLLPSYENKIKCIVIDPPYNTQRAFTHYQDKLNSASWLGMMYPRLILMRKLLSSDGSIWVIIDDRESHYLKIVMDEVFGRKNFVGNVVWQRKYGPINNSKTIARLNDHILVYRKTELFKTNLLPRTNKQNSRYKFDDLDGRGLYSTESLISGFQKNHIFPIKNPYTQQEWFPPPGKSWLTHQKKILQRLNENRLYFGKDRKGIPKLKNYLQEVKQGVVATTWWPAADFGDNIQAKKELKALFPENNFETIKPEQLIARIFHLATHENELILDAFLGSGTSAAVAHKMNRCYIGIEMGNHIKNYCAARLKKVIDGELGGISKAVNWQGGGGYRFFQLKHLFSYEIFHCIYLFLLKPACEKSLIV